MDDEDKVKHTGLFRNTNGIVSHYFNTYFGGFKICEKLMLVSTNEDHT